MVEATFDTSRRDETRSIRVDDEGGDRARQRYGTNTRRTNDRVERWCSWLVGDELEGGGGCVWRRGERIIGRGR